MNKQELTNLGLTEEQANAVFALNGKQITAEQEKNRQLENALSTLQGENDTYKEKLNDIEVVDVEKLKEEISTLKESISKRQDDDNIAESDKRITENILATIGDKQFTSAYAKNGIISEIKAGLADEKNAGKDISKLFAEITKDKDGIFQNPNPPAEIGGMGTVDAEVIGDNRARTVMGLHAL